jgi:multimeric flavodoxin WrbA
MLHKFRTLLAACAIVIGGAAGANAQVAPRFVAPHDIQGLVTYFNHFNMMIRADGTGNPVMLHQGTVINPTGTTLHPGMVVNVAGYGADGQFYADRINVVRF